MPQNEQGENYSRDDMRDLVNYLSYMGEPAKLERYSLGTKVILFLLVLTFLTRALYKEYWRDVH